MAGQGPEAVPARGTGRPAGHVAEVPGNGTGRVASSTGTATVRGDSKIFFRTKMDVLFPGKAFGCVVMGHEEILEGSVPELVDRA